MDNKYEEYKDFISFIDDDDAKKDWFVKIIEIGQFVTFETIDGNKISIPSTRILKIKKKRGDNY